MIWTRARITLQACLGAAALMMLYVGAFQIGRVSHLACPGFGGGCDSVAIADFSRPFGLANGLLKCAYFAAILAVAQIARKEAQLAALVMAALAVGLGLLGLADMHRLGAYCVWSILATLLAAAAVVLAAISAREPLALAR